MKIYQIYRANDGGVGCAVDDEQRDGTLDKRFPYPLHHVVYHSPTGFEYGYLGSGPSDLALSILADYYGVKNDKEAIDGDAWKYHNQFKEAFIARRNQDEPFEITENEIVAWLFEREIKE